MKKAASSTNNELPKTYQELCLKRWFAKPISDDVDYENALEAVEPLYFLAERTEEQTLYLRAVATFVEQYEDATREPPRKATVPELLAFLCDAHELSASDLSRILGDPHRTVGGKLLSGEREPSKAHIRILCEKFSLSPALFF